MKLIAGSNEWTASPDYLSLNDAIQTVSDAGGGQVRLDAETIPLDSPLELATDVDVIGSGRHATTLTFADGVNGIEVGSPDVRRVTLANLSLEGAGEEASAADCVRVTNAGSIIDCAFRNLEIRGWNGSAWVVDSTTGAEYRQNHHSHLQFRDVDAGSSGALLRFLDGTGPQNTFENLTAIPSDGSSASDSDVIEHDRGYLGIGSLSVGGSAGYAYRQTGRSQSVIGHVHYEATEQNDTSGRVADFSQKDLGRVGSVRIRNCTKNYAYGLEANAGEKDLGPVSGKENLSQNVIRNGGSPQAPCRYAGDGADIDNASGSATGRLVALGDLTKNG